MTTDSSCCLYGWDIEQEKMCYKLYIYNKEITIIIIHFLIKHNFLIKINNNKNNNN